MTLRFLLPLACVAVITGAGQPISSTTTKPATVAAALDGESIQALVNRSQAGTISRWDLQGYIDALVMGTNSPIILVNQSPGGKLKLYLFKADNVTSGDGVVNLTVPASSMAAR